MARRGTDLDERIRRQKDSRMKVQANVEEIPNIGGEDILSEMDLDATIPRVENSFAD